MKRLPACLAILLLPACTSPQKGAAVPLCDYTATRLDAWVNMMPGPGGPPRTLTVMMQVEPDGISRRLQPASSPDDGTLRLDLAAWGPPEGLSTISYRSKGDAPARIEIWCDGILRETIAEITIAQ